MGKRIRIKSGFVLLLALLFYLDEGIGLLFPGLAACLVHELGHILVIRLLGGRIEYLELTAAGAVLVLDARIPFSYFKEAVSALAGPLANFLCGGAAVCLGSYITAGLNLSAGIFNLLPVWSMDGGRALYSLLSNWCDTARAEKTMTLVSAVLLGVLFGAGLVLMHRWGNPTLLVTSGVLLTCTLKSTFLK